MITSKNQFYISPEDYLKGEKFADYQNSPSLREYVLINQSEMSIECFRLSDGNWVSQTYGLGDEVCFDSVDFRCDLAAIYRKVSGVVKSNE